MDKPPSIYSILLLLDIGVLSGFDFMSSAATNMLAWALWCTHILFLLRKQWLSISPSFYPLFDPTPLATCGPQVSITICLCLDYGRRKRNEKGRRKEEAALPTTEGMISSSHLHVFSPVAEKPKMMTFMWIKNVKDPFKMQGCLIKWQIHKIIKMFCFLVLVMFRLSSDLPAPHFLEWSHL